jgi:ribosome maturation factor RimP
MVDNKKITEFILEELEENMFLVEVNVSSSNVIKIFIDSFEGLTIDQCVHISRKLEQKLDRDKEDFELQVSSPGLSEPFRAKEQYLKNVGHDVEIVTTEGIKLEGELLEAGDEAILLKSAKRERVEGHKKKQLIVKEHQLKYGEIKSAKGVVSFKKAN